MAMRKLAVTIILPCYNEVPTFEKSVKKIVSVLKKLKKNWEIIFVEDKSTDKTKKTIEKLVSQIKNSRAIYHSKNQGRGKSVADGIKTAKGEICGFLDVDLEVSADYIPLFTREIENGADMTIGRRFYERGMKSIARYLASKIYSSLVKTFLKIPIEDTEAGYKFFNRSKILPILVKIKDKGWFWDTEICARAYWSNLKISAVPVLFVRRHDKKSTVNLLPDSWNYLTKIIKFRSNLAKLKQQK